MDERCPCCGSLRWRRSSGWEGHMSWCPLHRNADWRARVLALQSLDDGRRVANAKCRRRDRMELA